MKKISVLLLLVFMLSGCDLFNLNTMVCEYPLDPVTYEISYDGNDITRFTITEVRDYTNYKDAYVEDKVKEVNDRSEELNKVEGLNEDVSVDGKVITIHLDIDFNVYDIDKDESNVINLPLKQWHFPAVKDVRQFFVNKGYKCDELVDSKLR